MSLSFSSHEHGCFFFVEFRQLGCGANIFEVYTMNVIRQVPNKSGDSAFQLSLLLNGEGVIYGKFISFIRKWSFVWAVGLVKVRVTKLLFNMGCYKPRVPA